MESLRGGQHCRGEDLDRPAVLGVEGIAGHLKPGVLEVELGHVATWLTDEPVGISLGSVDFHLTEGKPGPE